MHTSDITTKLAFAPEVLRYFERAIDQDALAQSYVFASPDATFATMLTKHVVKRVLCERQGCDSCETCYKIEHDVHPDVHWYAPGSSTGYLVEQVRDITTEAFQTATMATHKFFVIEQAELLTGTSANALLKTVEEPPAHTHFVFITASATRMLPTLVSRSQVIRLNKPTAHEQFEMLRGSTGASDEDVRLSMALFSGFSDALYFLRPEGREVKLALQELLDALAQVRQLSHYLLIVKAKVITDLCLENTSPQLDDENPRVPSEFFSAKQLKEQEAAQKRKANLQATYRVRLLLEALSSVLATSLSEALKGTDTDVLQFGAGAFAACSYIDMCKIARLIEHTQEALYKRVSAQLALETLLLNIKELLCQK